MPLGCDRHGHQAAANETLLHAFLSWQMKMWVNPGGGGPGDLPMEVKGASILLPAALHHPWVKCISWAVELHWSDCSQ